MNYGEALQLLSRLGMLGVQPGTDRLAAALRRLGSPETRFVAVHIAGTNGKGSTAAFASSLLLHAAAGAGDSAPARIGLYTSPHLVRVRERIRVSSDDGEALRECTEAELAAAIERIIAACAAPPTVELTFFEVLTAAAFLIFAEQGVEIAVIETGLGGRLDATRLCQAAVAIVTSIGFDHTEILGPTLADIAREKAGIFASGVSAIAACDDDSARAVLANEARRVGSPLFLYEPRGEPDVQPVPPLPKPLADAVSLVGVHQQRNAALAIFAVRALKLPRRPGLMAALQDPSVQAAALAATRWPGRLERIWPPPSANAVRTITSRLPLPPNCEIWLDAAHNPEGAEALSRFLATFRAGRPLTILFGVVAGKDAVAMGAPLDQARRIILTRPPSPRGLDPALLEPLIRHPVQRCDDFREALQMALAATDPGGILLIYGSLFLIGAVSALWHDEPMDPLWVQDPPVEKKRS